MIQMLKKNLVIYLELVLWKMNMFCQFILNLPEIVQGKIDVLCKKILKFMGYKSFQV